MCISISKRQNNSKVFKTSIDKKIQISAKTNGFVVHPKGAYLGLPIFTLDSTDIDDNVIRVISMSAFKQKMEFSTSGDAPVFYQTTPAGYDAFRLLSSDATYKTSKFDIAIDYINGDLDPGTRIYNGKFQTHKRGVFIDHHRVKSKGGVYNFGNMDFPNGGIYLGDANETINLYGEDKNIHYYWELGGGSTQINIENVDVCVHKSIRSHQDIPSNKNNRIFLSENGNLIFSDNCKIQADIYTNRTNPSKILIDSHVIAYLHGNIYGGEVLFMSDGKLILNQENPVLHLDYLYLSEGRITLGNPFLLNEAPATGIFVTSNNANVSTAETYKVDADIYVIGKAGAPIDVTLNLRGVSGKVFIHNVNLLNSSINADQIFLSNSAIIYSSLVSPNGDRGIIYEKVDFTAVALNNQKLKNQYAVNSSNQSDLSALNQLKQVLVSNVIPR